MDWREAFFCQARSEHAVFARLNRAQVAYSHQLHYVQMVTEKLAKGFLTKAGSAKPPQTTHIALVKMLRVIKGRPEIRKQLGYQNAAEFTGYVDALLPLAHAIERLAPSSAGTTQPNPEYPWEDLSSHQVTAPARFPFPEFDPKKPKMAKMMKLVQQLLWIAR